MQNPSIEEACRIFLDIRDTYYSLGHPQLTNCAAKHLVLGEKLRARGYQTQLVLTRFKWNDLPIPKNILPEFRNPATEDWHLSLLAKNLDYWMHLDATWSLDMAAFGFPVYDWDGRHSTPLTVTPIEG